MKTRFLKLLLAASAAAVLAACGGGGDSTPVTPTPTPETPAASKFTQTATWTVVLPASGSVCYDFNAKAEVAGCTGTGWDVKLTSAGRTANFFTNSGVSGTGAGGAFGSPFTHTWESLLNWKDAVIDPGSGSAVPAAAYVSDAASGVFTGTNGIQSAAFEYDLNGTHQLHPNFRVFLIATDSTAVSATGTVASPVYALQVTGYYGGALGTASGHPSFRWINRTDSVPTVSTATVNATAGWVYYDLANKTTTSAAGTWHIAFNRYNVMLNSAVWGNGGKVGGFVGATPAGFYNGDGTPVVARFNAATNLADTESALTGTLAAPATANAWKKDAIGSQLSPTYTGTYPNPLSYGWYTYYPTNAAAAPVGLGEHQLKANPENATLIKSGEGSSYARMRVTSITYAPSTPAYNGTQTWTVEFGVQPAP